MPSFEVNIDACVPRENIHTAQYTQDTREPTGVCLVQRRVPTQCRGACACGSHSKHLALYSTPPRGARAGDVVHAAAVIGIGFWYVARRGAVGAALKSVDAALAPVGDRVEVGRLSVGAP